MSISANSQAQPKQMRGFQGKSHIQLPYRKLQNIKGGTMSNEETAFTTAVSKSYSMEMDTQTIKKRTLMVDGSDEGSSYKQNDVRNTASGDVQSPANLKTSQNNEVHRDELSQFSHLSSFVNSGVRKSEANIPLSSRRGLHSIENIQRRKGEVFIPPRYIKVPGKKIRPTTLSPRKYLHRHTPVKVTNTNLSSTTYSQPETLEKQPTTADDWFLMPVQGWFTFAVAMSAVVFVLAIICIILYYNWKKEKTKMKKLMPIRSWKTCSDPFRHESCSCRALSRVPSVRPLRSSSFHLSSSNSPYQSTPLTTLSYQDSERRHHTDSPQRSLSSVDDRKLESMQTIQSQVLDTSPPPLNRKLSGKVPSSFERNINDFPSRSDRSSFYRSPTRHPDITLKAVTNVSKRCDT